MGLISMGVQNLQRRHVFIWFVIFVSVVLAASICFQPGEAARLLACDKEWSTTVESNLFLSLQKGPAPPDHRCSNGKDKGGGICDLLDEMHFAAGVMTTTDDDHQAASSNNIANWLPPSTTTQHGRQEY
ncbi:hypothetical protein H6P81_010745 [Aristolochia fimbriata]|uniref:Uncharacterized protein n=1 Tax=Aristolochia fimbriata TaxID=158543 RepID=A0AAV7EPM6_ARIFI|nr:hypothetical protein H6P81_010745 [Aristolochia fimbriata]